MIIVDASKHKNIESALKEYKNKHAKIGIAQELRERQTYVKPSVKRRDEVMSAIYKESKSKKSK